jgi:predicted nucleic acid-binding protein
LRPGHLRVVFDINVYVDAIAGSDSTYPYLSAVPPRSSNDAADCLSLALDGEDFELYISPHILSNTSRVLQTEMNVKSKTVGAILTGITEIVHLTGGSIVDPERLNHDQKDFEDNLILDLFRTTEALVLVTSDQALLQQSPWNGRLILSPRRFVEQVIRTRSQRL